MRNWFTSSSQGKGAAKAQSSKRHAEFEQDSRLGSFGEGLLEIFFFLFGWMRWVERWRLRRERAGTSFVRAEAVTKREELRKALRAIEQEGFYTFDGLVSLAYKYYDDDVKAQRARAHDKTLSKEARAEAQKSYKASAHDLRELRRSSSGLSLARELEKLARQDDNASYYVEVPKGTRLKLVYDFFQSSGLLKSPVPVNWLVAKPKIVQSLVYKAAGGGDMLYHALRIATGQDDPIKLFEKDEAGKDQPFSGAVYQSFIYDNPYFKRGVFVVRNGDQRGPVEVEYFEAWYSNMTAGSAVYKQRYEDYYRGYLLDQGFDSYVFLFGPQDPSLKLQDTFPAVLAFKGLEQILRHWRARWEAHTNKSDLRGFLNSLDATSSDEIVTLLSKFVEDSEEFAQRASDEAEQTTGTRLPALADYTGKAAMEAIFNDPLLEGLQSLKPDPEPQARDFKAEARELKAALWTLFEVEGKPAPKAGQNRRIRTLYLEGANRAALTPNQLKGTVVAFDNMSKSEMLLERTIMYRFGPATADPVDLARLSIVARNRSDRFDMRQANWSERGVSREAHEKMVDFEPNYAEIFLALGYDVAPASEERKPFRINPVIANTGTDTEEMELVIEQ